MWRLVVKGIVQPKMKILIVILLTLLSGLYGVLSSAFIVHKMEGPMLPTFLLNTFLVTEQRSYRFRMTQG